MIRLLLIISLTITSCAESEKVESPIFSDSAVFKMSSNFSFNCFNSYTKNQYNFCIYFTNESKIFIGFDLNDKATVFSFKMPESIYKNEEIGTLRSFFIKNFDSIFLLHDYQLSIIDTTGKLKYSKVINNPESEELPDTIYGNLGGGFPVHYNDATNSVFCMQYSGKNSFLDTAFYRLPIEAEYSFRESQFKSLNVNYPKIYGVFFYGEATNAFRLVNGNQHIYSFNADANLYTLDILTGKKMIYKAKSSFEDLPITQVSSDFKEDMNQKMDHLLASPLYLNILFDKYRSRYYRFFYKPKSLRNIDGTYNTIENKELSLIVLDMDFKKIKEYNLGAKYLWFYSVVAKDGLYLLKRRKMKMKKLFQQNSILIFCILISLILTPFFSCKGVTKKKSADPYEDRIANLLPFLIRHNLPYLKTTETYILQADKCNVCSNSSLELIFEEQKSNPNQLLFLFTSKNNSLLNANLLEKFKTKPYTIYYDSVKELSKIGLSFMKNLHVTVENKKIKSWAFL